MCLSCRLITRIDYKIVQNVVAPSELEVEIKSGSPWLHNGVTSMSSVAAYIRPDILSLNSDDELRFSADQATRPVLVPKIPGILPVCAGYAETINAGKTTCNEDQAAAKRIRLVCDSAATPSDRLSRHDSEDSTGNSVISPAVDVLSLEGSYSLDSAAVSCSQFDDDILDVKAGLESVECFAAAVDSDKSVRREVVDCLYFAVFDGHAGGGAAQIAANCLHEHVKDRLQAVLDLIIAADQSAEYAAACLPLLRCTGRHVVSSDQLVVGALEAAFVEMDEHIAEERLSNAANATGGCAALCCLALLGRIYVAGCGDCRALLCRADGSFQQLSVDHTPQHERKRLQAAAFRWPELLGRHYSRLEYNRQLYRKDLRKPVLYRDYFMEGWALKTVREADLRSPLISHTAKPRLLNTIGVCRGLGDHNLASVDHGVPVKPFLSCVPEVSVFDASAAGVVVGEEDVIVLASDGLWDVLSNQQVAAFVVSNLEQSRSESVDIRYTLLAQDLVVCARGQPVGGRWQLADRHSASCDDITVLIVPVLFALTPACEAADDDDDMLQ